MNANDEVSNYIYSIYLSLPEKIEGKERYLATLIEMLEKDVKYNIYHS